RNAAARASSVRASRRFSATIRSSSVIAPLAFRFPFGYVGFGSCSASRRRGVAGPPRRGEKHLDPSRELRHAADQAPERDPGLLAGVSRGARLRAELRG